MKDPNKEKALVEKIIKRDEKAFFHFVREHEEALFNFIKRQIRDRQLAEEIAQDAFVDFLEALHNFHFQSSLKTFLFSIAKYKVIDFIRKKKVKKLFFSGLPSYIVEALGAVTMEDIVEKEELVNKIDRTFESLPKNYRLVLKLKYVDGSRVKAIAEKLSMNFKSTESLIFRARKAFIKAFNSCE